MIRALGALLLVALAAVGGVALASGGLAAGIVFLLALIAWGMS